MQALDKHQELGTEKISKLLWKYSLPGIVGMLVNSLYNVVDRIFIGNGVGSDAIAGVTIAFPVMMVSMGLSMLFGVGTGALISIRLGEQKREEAESLLGQGFILLFYMAILTMALGLVFLEPLLRMFGATETILPYAAGYTRVILYGTIFAALGFGLNGCIRSEGSPRIAMITMLISAVINIILDYVFIFPLQMGVEGAAWATIISQAFSAAWVLAYFTINKKSSIKLKLANFKLKKRLVQAIVAIGLAPFAMQVCQSVVSLVVNRSVVFYASEGEAALMLAIFGVVMSASSIFMMPIIGIAQGAQPIIGFNLGAHAYQRVKETVIKAMGGSVIFTLLTYLMIFGAPGKIIALFNANDPELVTYGIPIMIIMNITLPAVAIGIIGSQYFQATGQPKLALCLSLCRQFLLFIPIVLILPRFFGLSGVFYSFPVADTATMLLTAVFMLREFRRLDHLSKA